MYGLIIAFKNYNYKLGISQSPFVGLKNFEYLFSSKGAWLITRNTIGYNMLFIVLGIVLGVTLAIFLNEVKSKTGKKVYQTFILLPYLMSMVVVSYLTYAFLGERTGVLNAILQKIGLKSIGFYSSKQYWPYILTIVYLWRNIGYGTIIYLASIVGINSSLYEAADLDGASKWQQIRFITVPLLKPTIFMLATLAMGNIFRSDFGLFYQIPRNQGLLYAVTDTIDTYVFRALLINGDIGLSSAAAFYQSIVCFVTILIFNTVVKKVSNENALF